MFPFAFSLLYSFALTPKAFWVFELQTRNYNNTVWFAQNLSGFIISPQDLTRRLAKMGVHYVTISNPKETPFLLSLGAFLQFLPCSCLTGRN